MAKKKCQAPVCSKVAKWLADGIRLCPGHKEFYKNDFKKFKKKIK